MARIGLIGVVIYVDRLLILEPFQPDISESLSACHRGP